MQTGYLLKISVVLLGAIGLLLLLDAVILQGGVFVSRLGVIPARARLAASEAEVAPSKVNIRVKNFSVRPSLSEAKQLMHPKGATIVSPAHDFFRKGQKIEVSCTVENTSAEPAKNFQALIRIPGKDIASENIKTLKAGEEITLKGSFPLESTGLLYLACRADISGVLYEQNEHDNYEIAALYVLS